MSALYPPAVEPAPRLLPLIPFLNRFVRNPLRAIPRIVYDEPLVIYGSPAPRLVWVTNPALVENILFKNADRFSKTRIDHRVLKPILGNGLLTAQGESWRWQRKITSPPFRHSELLSYVPVMVEAADACIAHWLRMRRSSFVTDVETAMTDATFDIVTKTVLAGVNDADGEVIKRAGRAYLDRISWEVAASIVRYPERYWHPGKSRMNGSAIKLRSRIAKLVSERRNGPPGNDLVSRMLAAKDPDSGEPMSNEMIADNLSTFLFAGHETMAKALTWALYLLARAPEWQDRLRAEISDVIGNRPLDAATITKLPTLSRVLKETMRLYPPAPVMTRATTEETDLDGKKIPSGTLISIPIYVIHRHRTLWSDPDLFDPDRFLPEREAQYPRTQFMPFGYGQRICIGSAFATLEATAILATLLQKARFRWDQKHIPEPVSRVTLRPKGGMPLIIEPI
jgi:cytochrome P450